MHIHLLFYLHMVHVMSWKTHAKWSPKKHGGDVSVWAVGLGTNNLLKLLCGKTFGAFGTLSNYIFKRCLRTSTKKSCIFSAFWLSFPGFQVVGGSDGTFFEMFNMCFGWPQKQWCSEHITCVKHCTYWQAF